MRRLVNSEKASCAFKSIPCGLAGGREARALHGDALYGWTALGTAIAGVAAWFAPQMIIRDIIVSIVFVIDVAKGTMHRCPYISDPLCGQAWILFVFGLFCQK